MPNSLALDEIAWATQITDSFSELCHILAFHSHYSVNIKYLRILWNLPDKNALACIAFEQRINELNEWKS